MFNINFDRLIIDHFVFIHKFNDIIMIIYVDNIFICKSKNDNILNFKEKLIERFRIKNFELILYYLNVKIVKNRKNRIMHFNQINYIRQFVEKYEFINCKSTSIFIKQIFLKHDIFNDESYQTSKKKFIIYVEIINKFQ